MRPGINGSCIAIRLFDSDFKMAGYCFGKFWLLQKGKHARKRSLATVIPAIKQVIALEVLCVLGIPRKTEIAPRVSGSIDALDSSHPLPPLYQCHHGVEEFRLFAGGGVDLLVESVA